MIHQSQIFQATYTPGAFRFQPTPGFSGFLPKNPQKHVPAHSHRVAFSLILTLIAQLLHPRWQVQAAEEAATLQTVKDTANMSMEAQKALLNRLNPSRDKRLEIILAILIKSPRGRFLMAEVVRKNPGLMVSLVGEAARRQGVVAVTADDGSCIDIDGMLFPQELPPKGDIDRQTRMKQLTPEGMGAIRLLATIAHELLHAATLDNQNSIREEAKANKLATQICWECFPFFAGNQVTQVLAEPSEKELAKLPLSQTLRADNGIETYLKQTGLLK